MTTEAPVQSSENPLNWEFYQTQAKQDVHPSFNQEVCDRLCRAYWEANHKFPQIKQIAEIFGKHPTNLDLSYWVKKWKQTNRALVSAASKELVEENERLKRVIQILEVGILDLENELSAAFSQIDELRSSDGVGD